MIEVSEKLEIGKYRLLGGDPEKPFADISELKRAKHTKGNAQGYKAEKQQHWIIPIAKFGKLQYSIGELMERLFGPLP